MNKAQKPWHSWGKWSLGLLVLTAICCGTKMSVNVPHDEASRLNLPQVYKSRPPYPGRSGVLTAEEMKLARVAWKYFENNFQPTTGFVNAVDGYPSTTMWDMASYLGGMVAALELGIIDGQTFNNRFTRLTKSLYELDLFREELPNKVYHTITSEKVNYANKPGEIGFSALDLGRLLIWLRIIKERYPEHGASIDQILLRWNWCNVVDPCGTLYGAYVNGKKETVYVQEGRLGYEEYAAKGFQLWGFKTQRASMPEPYDYIPLFGVDLPYDTRDPRLLKAHNYVVCESYVLDGIELNWDLVEDRKSPQHHHTDAISAEFAQRVYLAQEGRYQETGIFTARTEHQLDGPPYFVYDTLYCDGFAWNTITEKGEYVPEFAAVALKGAFGLWVLWETPYTDKLYDLVSPLYLPEKGFFEGRYEKSGAVIRTFTANNNGIILECLLYKAIGKLLRFGNEPSHWDYMVNNPFYGQEQCLPNTRSDCGPGRKPCP